MRGELKAIYGSMFAGKSEELIRIIRRAEIAKKKVVIFKPAIDNRYDENDIVSHSGLRAEAFPITHVNSMLALYYGGNKFDVVAIDEAQFFDEFLFEVIERFINIGIDVIVAGLNQDFRGKGFGIMPELIARADKTIHLTAVCNKCGAEATKTQRLIDGKPASFKDETIVIGAGEQYEARCKDCYEVGY